MHERKMKLVTFIDVNDEPNPDGSGYPVKLLWVIDRSSLPRRGSESPTQKYYRELQEMKDYTQTSQKKAGKFVPSTDSFFEGRPCLNEYMTDAWWESGKPREVCSLSLRAGNGSGMATLTDADNEQSITSNGPTIEEALDRLEAYLASGNPSWRQWGKKKRS